MQPRTTMIKFIKNLFTGNIKKDVNFTPENLQDILDYLHKYTPQADKEMLINTESSIFHFTTGMSMRNSWGLWDKDSKIHKWFNSLDIFHPDDMSGIIIESFKRELCNQTIDLDAQVKSYKEYWKKRSGSEYTLEYNINGRNTEIKVSKS